jgi:acyl-CoA reductase-like NAD-dependent aldehyde dehydrogenase
MTAVEGRANSFLLAALGPKGDYRPLRRVPITDVSGRLVAELGLVPPLFIRQTVSALRKAQPLTWNERVRAVRKAGRMFSTRTVAGLAVEEYQRLVARVAGIPISEVRAATDEIGYRSDVADHAIHLGRPTGTSADLTMDLKSTSSGAGVWSRRGEVLAVHAPGNHPAVHSLWLQALVLGYRVAIRPSTKDPFTPHRLATALHDAGFGADHVCLLPSDHNGADELLTVADLAIVYGGDDVIARCASSSRVLGQGPGRSKILITADTDWRAHLDTIVDSVSHGGGTACVNATAVFAENDPSGLAEALADRLAALPGLPPEDDRAVLPVRPVASAQEIERHLFSVAADARCWLGNEGIVQELGDGSAVLKPAVHQVAGAFSPQIDVEMGFPCVWVAPWAMSDGTAALRSSLVVTALTRHAKLIEDLLAEPTIGNVHLGDVPTWRSAPHLPHDSYLSDFLMRTKTVISHELSATTW